MTVRKTSKKAYKEHKNSGLVGKRQVKIYDAFLKFGNHSNLEISKIVRLPINQVTPRVHELRQMQLLEYKQKRTCEISGKTVMEWGINPKNIMKVGMKKKKPVQISL